LLSINDYYDSFNRVLNIIIIILHTIIYIYIYICMYNNKLLFYCFYYYYTECKKPLCYTETGKYSPNNENYRLSHRCSKYRWCVIGMFIVTLIVTKIKIYIYI